MPSAAAARAQGKKTAKVVKVPVEDEGEFSSDSGSGSDSGSDGELAGVGISDSQGARHKTTSGSDSDSDSNSGSAATSNPDHQDIGYKASLSGSDSDSDSDSLHHDGPRKRRRTSPETTADSKTKRRLIASAITVPSRIRRVEKQASPRTNTTAPLPESTAGPTAPADATTTFTTLGVVPWLGQSLANLAIKRPTAIQKATIPEILKGRDCIGGSRTGSGKTVAFAVPMIQRWAENPTAIFGLILTPTRELALQIYEQIKAIGSPHYLKAGLIIGGADMRTQAIELAKSPHIIIATPGRLADHIRTSGEDTYAGLRRVRFVILDEADRLLADGFGSMRPDIEECLSVLPPLSERQTLLFTATMTPEIRALKDEPRPPGRPPFFFYEVNATGLAIPPTLAQSYLKIPVTHREHFLHTFLLTPANADKSVIIFCNRTATADLLHHLLRALDHRVTSLHSRLPQRQRTDNLGRFRASAARILIATDVAARGLDIPEVALVVNYDVPRDPDDYIHRVGRTARAGRKGEAVTFVGQRDVDLFLAIEGRVGAKMDEWREEGVNLETRVLRDALKVVSEKKREALLELEEGREVGGKRNRKKVKLRAT